MATNDSEGTVQGDIIKWMVDPNYCIETLTLKSATSDEIYVGSLLRDNTGYIVVANGQEANVTAISLERVTATGGEKIKCLVRGPAIIDQTELNYESSVTWNEVAAYLEALGIIDKPVNATWTTQTT
jgi:hypothetical protein